MKIDDPTTTQDLRRRDLELLASKMSARNLARCLNSTRTQLSSYLSGSEEVPARLEPVILGLLNAPRHVTKPSFTFIDLFAGIGGTRQGFEAAGGQCVFTSERDIPATETYSLNFWSDHEISGDITAIDAAEIPNHDVLVAGFPCQPFSLAGVSKKNSLGRDHGFKDKTQGTLFFDIARILDEKKPEAFLLENVKNLKSHDRGNTFRVIIETLTELGYYVQTRVIDAFGWVPQHRERIFIVGFKDPNKIAWQYGPNGAMQDSELGAEKFDLETISAPASEVHVSDILHGPQSKNSSPQDNGRFADPITGLALDRYTLSDKLWTYLKDYRAKHEKLGNGFGFGLVTGESSYTRTLSARYHKDGSEILIAQPGTNPRRLTPREAARLMGFPDTFAIPVSDTQAYRQFGNSVVVPVIESIATEIARYLG